MLPFQASEVMKGLHTIEWRSCLGHLWIALVTPALACTAVEADRKSKEHPLSQCTVFLVVEWPNLERRENWIKDPARDEALRNWIKRCAWPPIDTNTTGAVYPQWVIKGGKDERHLTIEIPVYGFIERSGSKVHVKQADREELKRIVQEGPRNR